MISINASTISCVSNADMTDRSVASACSLGVSGLSGRTRSAFAATGLSGFLAVRPSSLLPEFPVTEGLLADERPTKALEAGVAAAEAPAYVIAATGAGNQKQTKQHHTMWAFRGLEPWSDPA
ncbi:hypothetical protein BJP40_14285 [Streptomyces sp. CC53]|uniref:hypothetical protein n=1 Tax=unclassified Streptomyces TaxID=2593676 RepID=UPI0008DD2006|nr:MULTISPECIES: hypothetical protein [unclassified Streptomyces]OII66137.1 hypothetical protein BJP40_14285 [Streptomyces sp. CC53]OII68541.1 hypothetical protein BJP39_21065 [Streptomyces sp. CC77]